MSPQQSSRYGSIDRASEIHFGISLVFVPTRQAAAPSSRGKEWVGNWGPDLDTFGPYLFDILQQESRHSQERRDILITPVGALGPGGSIGGMGGLGGAKVPRTPPLGGVAQTEPSAPPPEPDPPETERANFDAENHPLAGVPNVEARHDRGWLVQVVSLN